MDLKKRTNYHKKKQKGLSPFGIGMFDNPVNSMGIFNNSTSMGEELQEENFGFKSGTPYYGGLPAEPEYNGPMKKPFYYKELLNYFKEACETYWEYSIIGSSPTTIVLKTPDGKEKIDLFKFDVASDADEAIEMASHYFDQELFEGGLNCKSMKENMNIKENLNIRDKKTDNKFDLLNLYESIRWGKDNKSILEKLLSKNAPNETIYRMLLKESMKLNENMYEFDDEYDFDDGEVRQGGSFFCDGYDWKWIRRIGDVEHLDFDNWAVWMAFRPEDENRPEGRNIVNFFVVDEDTGFIDWGPVETEKEAREFLQSKVNDWEEDLDEKLSKETDPNKKAELERQIDGLEDEIGDAIENDDMYAQTSLVKKQKALQEGPQERSFTKIVYNELVKYLKEHDFEADVSIYDENLLVVMIEGGDWKHDHLYFNDLIAEFFWDINEAGRVTSRVTDSDGSDTYSAEYRIYLQNEPLYSVDEDLSKDDLGNVLYNNDSDKMHIVTKDDELQEEFRHKTKYNNTEFVIKIDGDVVQISSIHPYDDAEYCWAQSKDGGITFMIYRYNKMIEFYESDLDVDDFTDVLAEMDRLDKDTKPIMVHN